MDLAKGIAMGQNSQDLAIPLMPTILNLIEAHLWLPLSEIAPAAEEEEDPEDEPLDPDGTGKLEIDIIRAQKLPIADANGLSDPFVNCRLNGEKLFSPRRIYKNRNPVWND
ncbi:hypothetical protein M427DRAFT_131919 [Gonapodya prolifera JEL478]|uniref:C2 domain-containing protein n=1 Tax=Gonapodya prolifera (strain JEL478) TaxID=1344416 RepID=A0A139ARJ6_GONPJ|nr:hypothetical protein M427DRAFT_131919 [Gonapodya prolifera JEL478]|eukprot:KXS19380.1 hypothetical protein M427DRAFT_131919 [Gonapodya prolifera JEL478]